MASLFETFIQLELPKRPYLETDVAQETVIVRRGANPRQLGAVALTDNQVLVRQGGVLTGRALGTNGSFIRYAVIDVLQANASATWTATHNLNSFNVVWQIYQNIGTDMAPVYESVLPNKVTLTSANEAVVEFNSAMAGKAVFSFVD